MALRIRNLRDVTRLSVDELSSDSALALLRPMVEGIYLTSEVDEINQAQQILEETISRVDKERGESWSLRSRYLKLIALLRFGLLAKLNDGDVRQLLSHDLLYLLNEEEDIIQRLQFAVFMWGDEDGQRRKNMLSALTENPELVGDKPLKDWIRDYESSLPAGQQGALGIESYLSHSPLVRAQASGQEDKEVLRKVLKIYDWLKQGGPLPGEMVFSELKAERTARRAPIGRSAPMEPEAPVVASRPSPQAEAKEPPRPELAKAALEKELADVHLAPEPPAVIKPKVIKKPEQKPVPPQPSMPAAKPETLPVQPLRPAPQAMRTAEPAFFFDLEDEQEADKHRSTVEGHLTLEQELRRYADEVIQQNNLAFKDEVNKRRFIQLFVSRLKDVRGTVEVREALLKPVETGGLALDAAKAEQVVKLMESAKQEFAGRLSRGEVKPRPEPAAPAPLPPRPPQPVKGLPSRQQPQKPSAPAFDAARAEEWRQQMLKELQTQAPAQAAPARQAVRPQLMDVKASPKVVGPLEELATLSLTDFRRLGVTPAEALVKVRAKIDLIGETSIARRIEAIKAWHASPIYRQYLSLGRESIEQGQPITQVISGRHSLGEQVLSEAEFNAVVDFNSKLRF